VLLLLLLLFSLVVAIGALLASLFARAIVVVPLARTRALPPTTLNHPQPPSTINTNPRLRHPCGHDS